MGPTRFGGALVDPYAQFKAHVLFRGLASDWNGTTLDGENVTMSVLGASPATSGDALRFTNDALEATVSVDLNGKAFFIVANVAATDSAQDMLFQFNQANTNQIGIDSKATGQFQALMRSVAAFGFGSTLVSPTNIDNAFVNTLGTTTVYGYVFDPTIARVLNGATASTRTTKPDAALNMQRLVIGRAANGNYVQQADLYEFCLLDTTDEAVINNYLSYLADTYTIGKPLWTPATGGTVFIGGDSIAVGSTIAADEDKWRWIISNNQAAKFSSYAISGGQVSTFGFTSPTDDSKIALTFSRVFTSGNMSGEQVAIFMGGANDKVNDVPLGTYGVSDEADFYGALEDGWADFVANAPSDMILWLCSTVNLATDTNGEGLTFSDYDAALSNFVTQKASARLKFIDLRSRAGLTAGDFSDALHPNAAGAAKIASVINADMASQWG